MEGHVMSSMYVMTCFKVVRRSYIMILQGFTKYSQGI